MRYISTRTGLEATSAESIFQGLAPDGGLYVPDLREVEPTDVSAYDTLKGAEDFVLGRLFDDLPQGVRDEAVARLLSRFPAGDPVPIVEADGLAMLELFHGRTGAFKDVAFLS